MAERPRIGVTGNGRRWAPAWWCTSLALRLAGSSPERISTRHAPSGKELDAMLIGGGNDISPEHYQGDMEAQVKLDHERDKLEIAWIKLTIEQGLPLMGICRGAQLINVVLGGNLHQDIRGMRRLTYNRPGLLPTKQVHVEADSTLATICGKTRLRVNSLHHQAVDQAADELRIVGRDLDELPQAVESRTQQRIIGVQWHPEYLFYLPAQFALFRWLVREAEKQKVVEGS